MTSVTPTTTTSTTTASTSATDSTDSTDPLLSKDAFLQLMMAQLQNQDPLDSSSSDPDEMVEELAEFTSVEQETNTAQSTAQSASEQETSSSIALIGHTVSYVDSSGNTDNGVVQSVEITSSGPTLTINGVAGIDPTTVSEVS